MAPRLRELAESRRGTKGESFELHFQAHDCEDEQDVDAIVAASLGTLIPYPVYDGLFYQTYRFEPVGFDLWSVIVLYGRVELRSVGSYEYQFTTGNNTIRRTTSLATVLRLPVDASGAISDITVDTPMLIETDAPHGLTTGDVVNIAGTVDDVGASLDGQYPVTVLSDTTFTVPEPGDDYTTFTEFGTWSKSGAPNFDGLIGVNGSNVEGVEIPGPGFDWAETWTIPNGVVTTSWVDAVSRMRGTINAEPFRGFAIGEVMFKGMTGGKRSAEDLQLTFNFERQFHETNIPIAQFTIPAKLGWDYVWTLIEDRKNDSVAVPMIAPRVRGVYVERVVSYSSFALLGIGTLPLWEL